MDRGAIYDSRDGTVLYQQAQYRSDDILDGDLDEVLQAKRANGTFWHYLQQHDHLVLVQQILHQVGFYGVYRCGWIKYNCHLIAVMVERWQSETYTFHFRVGKVTVTLQDVQVIWVLPIDDEPVIGIYLDRTTNQWQDYCMEYLGFQLDAGVFKGSRLQIQAIISHIARVKITPNTPHQIVVQYARVVALFLVGRMMCPDSSGNLVSLLYLAKLEDIMEIRNYSCGSAVLAFLYRELCNASRKGNATISGALQLSPFRIVVYSQTCEKWIPTWRCTNIANCGMLYNITSHRQRISSSQMCIESVERDDVRVDITSPPAIYTPQDYYVPQPPQDYYVPQPPQDDWFQSAPYVPRHAEAYYSHVDLDLGVCINNPYAS
ncbi:protein MAINTENANCE OF MERISTEMS [Sesamum angolense]|uniref:Protein MAINTENANCE OF MERISTEMS n=1 Tax=Sesamum angolense TaxID=2727404 RepID=A0AAE1W2S4_9LAMI|nr:protein MAINTENANCE OF MERISTEMS [Sesamum angolense]